MAHRAPRTAVNCTDQWNDDAAQPADRDAVMPWEDAQQRLAGADLYWSATVGAHGRPHVRPVFAVWIDDLLYTTTNGQRAKARNLAADSHVAFSTRTDEVDFVVEGTAAPVTDAATLERVADAYRAEYGWPLTVRDGELYAPFGAPAAGPPPYHAYVVTPDVIFGLGVNDTTAPVSTRWQF